VQHGIAAENRFPGPAMTSGRLALAVLTVVTGFALSGCGRRATEADCRLIVDRSVELVRKAQAETDAQAIASVQAQVRAELDEQIRACEGRRVTDKTMTCVGAAQSAEELDQCLR
jgi:hypothetical protein